MPIRKGSTILRTMLMCEPGWHCLFGGLRKCLALNDFFRKLTDGLGRFFDGLFIRLQ
jgi:hypothetical protein